MSPAPRISVVVLTHNRADELLRTLGQLSTLPEHPPLVVVDNGSSDGTAVRVAERFPRVQLVRCMSNLGAAGRNAGVARLRTPYVAFCDDDTWWAPGALARAADHLDAHPVIGVLQARVLVGPEQRVDPACQHMAASPLDSAGLPGPALVACMAGACVMRTKAFLSAGGYEPRLFLGGEEQLLSLDLLAAGWRIVYAPDVVCHHHPSANREPGLERRLLVLRNRLWVAWMRLPVVTAWQETAEVLREGASLRLLRPLLSRALPGMAWAFRTRKPVPDAVDEMYRRVRASLRGAAVNAAAPERVPGR